MTEYAFIIPLLPLFAFVMIVFLLRWKEKVSAGFSIAMIVISWLLSVLVLIETIDRIEKGQDPKLSTYLRLLRALGITAEGRGALVAGLVPMEGAADV